MAHLGLNAAYEKEAIMARQAALAGGGAQDSPLNDLLTTGKQVVGAMGLFGQARALMDDNAVKNSTDKIARALEENGGDWNSLPKEMVTGANNMKAMANVMDYRVNSEKGKVEFAKNAAAMAESDLNMIGSSYQLAQDLISKGDHVGAGKVISNASKLAGNAHQLEYDPETNKYKVQFVATATGQPESTGQEMDPSQVGDIFKGLLSNSDQFRKTAMVHYATTLQHNLATAKNTDAWLESKDSSGKKVEFIPSLRVQPGVPTETAYTNVSTGKSYNLQELMDAGFAAPASKASALKEEKMAQTQANNEAKNAMKLQEISIKQQMADTKDAATLAVLSAKLESLGLAAAALAAKTETNDVSMGVGIQNAKASITKLAHEQAAREGGLSIDKGGTAYLVPEYTKEGIPTGENVPAGKENPRVAKALVRAQEIIDLQGPGLFAGKGAKARVAPPVPAAVVPAVDESAAQKLWNSRRK